MRYPHLSTIYLTAGVAAVASVAAVYAVDAAPPSPPWFTWATVVNNNDLDAAAPRSTATFNSYNQPSVNVNGLVVIRARSIGGGGQPATHGIYTRDMGGPGGPGEIVRILDRKTVVPQPNNLRHPIRRDPVLPAHRHDVGHHRHARQSSAGVEVPARTGARRVREPRASTPTRSAT